MLWYNFTLTEAVEDSRNLCGFFLCDILCRCNGSHTLTNKCRCVWHCLDDFDFSSKQLCYRFGGLSGCNHDDDDILFHNSLDLIDDNRVQERLYRQHNDVAYLCQLRIVCCRIDAIAFPYTSQTLLVDVGYINVFFGSQTGLDDPPDHRTAHVSAADKSNGLVHNYFPSFLILFMKSSALYD